VEGFDVLTVIIANEFAGADKRYWHALHGTSSRLVCQSVGGDVLSFRPSSGECWVYLSELVDTGSARPGGSDRSGHTRRNKSGGVWVMRVADGKRGNWVRTIGAADDFAEADGGDVLNFWQAQDKVRSLARADGAATAEPSRRSGT